jgi:hypothetical protein
MAVMVVLPFAYSITLLAWTQDSASRLSSKATQVLKVPWASNDLYFEEKSKRLFDSLEELKAEAEASRQLHDYGLLLMLLLALRLVKATQLHPRVGILVETIRHSLEGMLHFCFLVFIIYTCAACIGFGAFGSDLDRFSSFPETVQTLINLTLGEWPENTFDNYKVMLFTLTFLILNFFVLLNFVIAIVVDAFAHAKRAVEDDPTLSSVWSDVKDAMTSEYLRLTVDGWPDPVDAKRFLEKLSCHYLTPFALTNGFAFVHEGKYLSEAARRTVATRWVRFYHKHDSCRAYQTHPTCVSATDPNQKLKDMMLQMIKVENRHIVEQLSVMLDTPIPSPMVVERQKLLLLKRSNALSVQAHVVQMSLHQESSHGGKLAAEGKHSVGHERLSPPLHGENGLSADDMSMIPSLEGAHM